MAARASSRSTFHQYWPARVRRRRADRRSISSMTRCGPVCEVRPRAVARGSRGRRRSRDQWPQTHVPQGRAHVFHDHNRYQ